jgi:hypothetical protein
MKNISRTVFLFLLFVALFGIYAFQYQMPVAQQGLASPTPTYDPLAEPFLPPNPTELELGQNLYWHWCMPCHGDKGQGLTDEFRSIWEPEHQNCWARGCHTGHRDDQGFPIPTIVPGLVNDGHLAQFSSLQEFDDYLQATHPPQSPGVLKSQEYHAIALFVFTLNGRPLVVITSTAAPVSTATETLIPPKETSASQYSIPINIIAILTILTIIVFVLIRRMNIQERVDPD